MVDNRPTQSYPYLLGNKIIKKIVKNNYLPFKSQDELLWGINQPKPFQIDWNELHHG